VRTCEYDGPAFTEPRSHPWTTSRSSPDHRYIDLKAEPGRVRTSLEDLTPWARYPAIDALYGLLTWLNGPRSTLESNDCAFTGPGPTDAPGRPMPVECSGRVMVLYRALSRNLVRGDVEALASALHRQLAPLEPTFRLGVVGTSIVPVRYRTLPEEAQLGHQLMISFWAWGGSESDTMKSLGRVIRGLSRGLAGVEPADPRKARR